jgi:hypothetical protein
MKVLICYYSTYGNVFKMANLVAEGVSQVAGAQPVVVFAGRDWVAGEAEDKTRHGQKPPGSDYATPFVDLVGDVDIDRAHLATRAARRRVKGQLAILRQIKTGVA